MLVYPLNFFETDEDGDILVELEGEGWGVKGEEKRREVHQVREESKRESQERRRARRRRDSEERGGGTRGFSEEGFGLFGVWGGGDGFKDRRIIPRRLFCFRRVEYIRTGTGTGGGIGKLANK